MHIYWYHTGIPTKLDSFRSGMVLWYGKWYGNQLECLDPTGNRPQPSCAAGRAVEVGLGAVALCPTHYLTLPASPLSLSPANHHFDTTYGIAHAAWLTAMHGCMGREGHNTHARLIWSVNARVYPLICDALSSLLCSALCSPLLGLSSPDPLL